ncbi:hypothetical protein RJ639_005188 [Escallonia herrerae]|uniref:Uncharacterized protein n=1 Tax=Escallonia herrerae TaxID=1293975 RepID=A0AA88W1N5_9ASTE|nr:hypothetical protein RJ639_005188 [Escallonia herrerae]
MITQKKSSVDINTIRSALHRQTWDLRSQRFLEVSVDRGERRLGEKRIVPWRSKEVSLFQIYNMDSGSAMEMNSHVDLIRMNHPFHRGQ